MPKRVLSIGQCGVDHPAISRFLADQFAAVTQDADSLDEALTLLGEAPFDLVLVNRVLDATGDDGLEVIRQLKADPSRATTPVMLVSNYPDFQAKATALGATPGFGKQSLRSAATRELLAKILG